MKMVSVAAGTDKSCGSRRVCRNHFPPPSSSQDQTVGVCRRVQPGETTLFVTSPVIGQSLDSDMSSTSSEQNLSFTVYLMSGRLSTFQGFSYDDLTSKLESSVISWISDIQGIHPAFLKIQLREEERVLDVDQTFRKNELTDGMEISVRVSPDGPPPLVVSSDTDSA